MTRIASATRAGAPYSADEARRLGHRIGNALRQRSAELSDTGATEQLRRPEEIRAEVEMVARALERHLEGTAAWLHDRRSICGHGEWAALMLPSNMLATVVLPISELLVGGNSVHARMTGRASRSAAVLQSVFDEVVPGAVLMERDMRGPEFIEHILRSDSVPFAMVFGGEGLGDSLLGHARAGLAKRIVFEGPGKDPFIVLDGASLPEVAETLIRAKFMLSGQTCVAPENVIVHRTVHDEIVERLVAACEQAATGPMISPRVPPIVRAQLADAELKGAQIVYGGATDERTVHPTVVTGVTPDMSLFQDETFAPVFAVAAFDDPAEAVDLARAGRFGLWCTVLGPGADRIATALQGEPYAHPVSDLVFGRYGQVHLSPAARALGAPKPFGGYGKSGWIWDGDGLRQGPKLAALEATV